MLRLVAVVGAILVCLSVVAAAFQLLKTACSSDSPLVKIESQAKPDRADDHSEGANSSQKNASPQKGEAKPTATFDFRITDPNKIQGSYYTETGDGEKGDWGHKFWCDTKIGEFAIAVFTFFLVIFTGGLWWSTHRLWAVTKIVADADRPHLIPDSFTISGIRQTFGEDGTLPLKFEYRFKNFGRSPAFMKRYNFMIHTDKGPLPAVPAYDGFTDSSHIVAAVTGWWGTVETPSVITIPEEYAAELLSGQRAMIVYGVVEYADTAQAEHKIRFAYQFIFGEGDTSIRFTPAGPESYREYT